jgi:alpha-2-macroglobulin
MHFLVEAKVAGFAPPALLLAGGLRHLQAMVALDPTNLRDARTQAYAIYLLTREGVVTTNYILNLRDYLDRQYSKRWQADLTGVYLAGAYSLLKKEDEARRIIRDYRLGALPQTEWWDFHTPLSSDAQYVAMAARHFPDLLRKMTADDLRTITEPIGRGEFSTLSAAYAVLALKSYSRMVTQSAPELTITEVGSGRKETPLRVEGGPVLKRASFSPGAEKLRFQARHQTGKVGAYYQLVEAGYEAALPDQIIAEDLEIDRELMNAAGEPTQTARLGDPLTVRLRIRSPRPGGVANVAITDLLPGGFEVAANALTPGPGAHGCDFVEVREDRAVFFTTIGPRVKEISYQIKPTNRGEFLLPPAFAESMYDRGIKARSLPGKVTVLDAK